MTAEPQSNQQVSSQAAPLITPSLPGISLSSTADILTKDSRMCQLIWAPSGYGKTNLAGSLDALTQKYHSKRTLYIPVEAGEGGGAATIRHLDIPSFVPKDLNDFNRVVGLLRNDKSIGGIVLDSASEFNNLYIKPAALRYPARENIATRAVGIPTRTDYGTMGELMSQALRALIQMTTHDDPSYRKHIIVTAADLTREEDEKITFIGPALPGRMSREATQMFQQVGSIYIKAQTIAGKREMMRYLTYSVDGVKAQKDRLNMFPQEILLRRSPKDEGHDLLSMYETWWLPAVAAAQAGGARA